MDRITVDMSSADIFQLLKKSWIIVFLVPCVLALLTFAVFKSTPAIWEGRAVIKVGKISPAGIGLVDREVVSQIEDKWMKASTSSLVRYARIAITNKDDFYCEVIVGSEDQVLVRKSIENLFNMIETEQLRLLSLGIQGHNEHVELLTKKINEVQASLKNYREIQKSQSQKSRESFILDDLIATKEGVYNGLIETRERLEKEVSSNLSLKTYYSENIKIVRSPAQPSGNLIVVLVFMFTFLVVGTFVVLKKVISVKK